MSEAIKVMPRSGGTTVLGNFTSWPINIRCRFLCIEYQQMQELQIPSGVFSSGKRKKMLHLLYIFEFMLVLGSEFNLIVLREIVLLL
jgi:hypothetical protein